MLKRIGLSVVFLCLLCVGKAYAIIDSGPAINGTPSQFAIYALEDMFTYDGSNRDKHFEEMRNAYFSEKGWSTFDSIINKPNSLFGDKNKRNVLAVYEYWKNSDKDRDDYGPNQSKKIEEQYEFSGEFIIIFMNPDDHPKDQMKINNKWINRPTIKLKITGVKDKTKVYGSHYISNAPAYNYKIESFEIVYAKDG